MTMKTNAARARKVLSLAMMMGAGVLAVDLAPAFAKPPPHAPAHGYRRKHEGGDFRNQDWRRRGDEDDWDEDDYRYQTRRRDDRYRTDDRRRTRYSRRDDIDGDGIPNVNDRDVDGDGIRNERDRDNDNDGYRNDRDRYPRDPSRH